MICSGAAVPVTPIELVSRLTEQLSTPGTARTAFSTRALHAAQLIPVTLYCSKLSPPGANMRRYLINFCNVASKSSSVSSLPALISSATQVRICVDSSSRLKAFSAAPAAADWAKISVQ